MRSVRWSDDRRFRLQPAPHVVIGTDGLLRAWNPAWERAFGSTAGAPDGRSVRDLLHPDDRARVEGELGKLARGEEALTFSARLVGAGGSERFTEWNAVALPEEDGGAVMAVVLDVTDRHAAILEAIEKERFLETLMANLPGMVYRCLNDPQWTMVFASAGTEALTGYTQEDLLFNKSVAFGVDITVPEDQGPVWDVVQEALARREPFVLKYRIRTKGGALKWVQEKGRGIFDDTGELLGIEGFVIDISESVRVEQELIEKLRIIEAQRDAIRSLSTPIIEVWEGVLTLPIVGVVDNARAAEITQALLNAVVEKGCRHAILDLTGVEGLDSSTADHLLKMVKAVELLGARGVLVGIRPEVAQTLVTLGVDLSRIVTLSDLRQGLLACMRASASASAPERAAGALGSERRLLR
jgi:anti-anti-sigma factor